MQDIKAYSTFTKIEPVLKGWSSDKKYYIETTDRQKLLLRVSDISEYDKKRAEFEMMTGCGFGRAYVTAYGFWHM